MGYSCCVKGCHTKSQGRKVDHNIRFFRIPTWKKGYGRQDSAMPVHLKGGSGDTLLYRLTMGLTVLGSGYVIYELVKATLPKKTE